MEQYPLSPQQKADHLQPLESIFLYASETGDGLLDELTEAALQALERGGAGNRLATRRLRWYGHCRKMEEDR